MIFHTSYGNINSCIAENSGLKKVLTINNNNKRKQLLGIIIITFSSMKTVLKHNPSHILLFPYLQIYLP